MNQQERVKDFLEKVGSITPLSSWKILGVYRLSDAIHKLRKKGMNIKTEDFEVVNQFGEKCTVARYVLG